jgi:SAM-dependent methyltransferase
MLAASRARILEQTPASALVLDVGGGAQPFPRADWVIDLLAYEDRGLYGEPIDPAGERFSAETWVSRDICDRDPWPFADKQFDFAVCSHTLEDVRDPLWVCAELIRVARAGYIEVPSRLEEQSYGLQGPWAGWGHHRWLIDLDGDELTFAFKHHVLHNRPADRFPPEFHRMLSEQQRVLTLWWEGSFRFRERIFLDGPSLDAYLQEFVAANLPPVAYRPPALLQRILRRAGASGSGGPS